jgi:hypothetical protein
MYPFPEVRHENKTIVNTKYELKKIKGEEAHYKRTSFSFFSSSSTRSLVVAAS